MKNQIRTKITDFKHSHISIDVMTGDIWLDRRRCKWLPYSRRALSKNLEQNGVFRIGAVEDKDIYGAVSSDGSVKFCVNWKHFGYFSSVKIDNDSLTMANILNQHSVYHTPPPKKFDRCPMLPHYYHIDGYTYISS